LIIAGFDIATTTGAAVLRGSTVLHVEAFRSPGTADGLVFRNFRRWFRNILTGHHVERVAIEQPLVTNITAPDTRPRARPGETHNPITMKTYLRLYGLRAHAVELCERLGVDCIEVHQGTWRKSFTGNGRATKEQTLLIAQRIVPGLKSKDIADAIGVAWHLNGELAQQKLFGDAA
jgi:Holliday junction resolvasome RuvABC endonuclease subunit